MRWDVDSPTSATVVVTMMKISVGKTENFPPRQMNIRKGVSEETKEKCCKVSEVSDDMFEILLKREYLKVS